MLDKGDIFAELRVSLRMMLLVALTSLALASPRDCIAVGF